LELINVNTLAVHLAKFAEDAESQEYLDVVKQVEPEVDDLAGNIAENLNIQILPLDDNSSFAMNLCTSAPRKNNIFCYFVHMKTLCLSM
jgi:hypothetical protein